MCDVCFVDQKRFINTEDATSWDITRYTMWLVRFVLILLDTFIQLKGELLRTDLENGLCNVSRLLHMMDHVPTDITTAHNLYVC